MIFSIYKSTINGLFSFTKWLTIVSTGLLVTVMILNVIFRYFLKLPLIWADEAALFLFAWCTFLGASLTVRNNTMAAVTVAIDYLPKHILKYIRIVIQILIISFSVIVAISATNWVMAPSTINTISPSSGVPMWVPYMILPVGLVLIIIFSIDNIVNILLGETDQEKQVIEKAS